MSHKYIDQFIRLNCARDILTCFPNSKEITESMGAFSALIKHMPGMLKICADPNIFCLVPGDGYQPRTGALVAHRTRWQVMSVDPKLRNSHKCERLMIVRKRVEEATLEIQAAASKANRIVVLAVHSHAPLDACFEFIKGRPATIVAIPCCVPQQIIGFPPSDIYIDHQILSPKNVVYIWQSNHVNIDKSRELYTWARDQQQLARGMAALAKGGNIGEAKYILKHMKVHEAVRGANNLELNEEGSAYD